MKTRLRWPFLYNLIGIPVMEAGLFLGSFFSTKAKRTRDSRRKALARIPELVAAAGGKKPRFWFHAASAGEFLQIRPLMANLRTRYPDGMFLVSFFSHSAEQLAEECEYRDISLCFPGDTKMRVRKLLAAARPDIILFSKYDVWPNLAWESSKRGVKLAIVGATLHERSGRLRRGVRGLYRDIHRHVDFVGASTEEDATLYMKLGVDSKHIVVTGDMRYDQTFHRASEVSRDDPLLRDLAVPGRSLVAGSTWPADEKMLIPAFRIARENHPALKLIVVPHEIREQQIEAIESAARDSGLAAVRYTKSSGKPERLRSMDIIIVDLLGVLAKIYAAGIAAYVGGGFGEGVHNVMEPACFSLPVFIGPRWSNSREASLMLRKGAAFQVRKPEVMANLLVDILDKEEWRQEAGKKARDVVESNLGATEKTLSELTNRFPDIFEKT